jgi:hypothetical protein
MKPGLIASAAAAFIIAVSAGMAAADEYSDYGNNYYSGVDGNYQDESYERYTESDDPTCHHNHRSRYRYQYSSADSYRADEDYGNENHYSLKDEPQRSACLNRWQIEDSLARQGWRGLHGLQLAPDTVGVTARRPNGLVYRLKIDKCSGVIIAANLIDQQNDGYGATASYDAPQY